MHAILFDIGNVLVRYDHQRTMAALAALYDVDPAELLAVYAEIGRRFGAGEISPNQVVDLLSERFGVSRTLDEFSTAFCAGLNRDHEALAYSVALRVDGELAVGAISNTNATHVVWLDVNVPELTEFDLVLMSNEVGLLKPDPEIFELAMEILDTPAAQILYVDDLIENVKAARALGMTAIHHRDWSETCAQISAWRTISSSG
jgi:putative hydrolase of the HAD superfamily